MNIKNKIAIVLTIIFEITTIMFGFKSLKSGNSRDFLISILVGICFLIPFMISAIANRKKILLPSGFNIVSILFIFGTQYLGELRKFYTRYWWWDLLLHGVFGIYTVIISLNISQGIISKNQGTSQRRYKILNKIYAFSFSVALGTIWEIFEYVGDYLFKTKMVKGGLEDTATDLLVHLIAAFVTAVFK
jgi:hypothetical protein